MKNNNLLLVGTRRRRVRNLTANTQRASRRLAPTILCLVFTLMPVVFAREYHVAITGNDTNPGTPAAPLRTIQRAADLAQPGDTITVHEGVYRERVNPPRGGTSDNKRIVYQAALGEKVEIKGSEVVKGWTKVQGDVWKVTLPNSFFGSFNPYSDLIRGDWFRDKGRPHHTGAVYLNGEWLSEAATLEGVTNALWFAKVDDQNTTIWAHFKGVNPNDQLVEINVRQTVFYPDKPGRNFITVRGFTMRHAATPWAPPTAEQIGLIGTHWSKGWIIEHNIISHSICSGIALGKHGDQFDNTSANTAEGYVKTIERAHAHAIPWTKANIGHHIVCNNYISHCEQAGIVGSLGCAFSTVTGNVIHDIHVRQLFTGAEMAGIKFHAAIDTEIRNNYIHHTTRGLWLDWMAQGTRVTQNLFHDNGPREDLFVEVDHGPFVVDNNIFLSPIALLDMSEGGAYAHNLFAGKIVSRPELRRETPYHPAHSTKVAGLDNIKGGDNRFYNNILIAPASLADYEKREFPSQIAGNVTYEPAQTAPKMVATYLLSTVPESLPTAKTTLVTTKLLGKTKIARLPYETPNGSPLTIDTDYFGKARNKTNPTAGPFENPDTGPLRLRMR